MKFLKKLVVASLSMTLLFFTMSSVSALEDVETFTIDGIQYIIDTKEDENYRYTTVTSSKEDVSTAKYSKTTGELIVDGEKISEEYQLEPRAVLLPEGNARLSTKTYVLSGSLTAIISALGSIYGVTQIVQFASAVMGAFVASKDLLTTISTWRAGLPLASGTYKGKYKYWTNVQMNFRGSGVFLNENHSIYYQ